MDLHSKLVTWGTQQTLSLLLRGIGSSQKLFKVTCYLVAEPELEWRSPRLWCHPPLAPTMPIWTIVSRWRGGLSPQWELGKASEGLEDPALCIWTNAAVAGVGGGGGAWVETPS